MKVKISKLSKNPEDFQPKFIKCVKCGNVTEFVELQFHPTEINILRLSADYYVKRTVYENMDTYYDTDLRSTLTPAELSECAQLEKEIEYYIAHDNTPPSDAQQILMYEHSQTKADDACQQSVKRSLQKIRQLINTNCVDAEKLHWVTLTYAENMTDTEQLKRDFQTFWQRFTRWCKKQGYPVPEYITVVEPQGRGAWHCHCFFIWSCPRPYIPNNSVLAPMWGKGFVQIKGCDDKCDNVGAYFSAYLSDMSLDEYQRSDAAQTSGKSFEVVDKSVTVDRDGQPVPKTDKKFVKGARLVLYPPNMRIYRISRGIRQPEVKVLTQKQAEKEKAQAGKLTFQATVSIEKVEEGQEQEGRKKQVVHKEYYNKKRK